MSHTETYGFESDYPERLGEMRDRSFEKQRYHASGLKLVVAALLGHESLDTVMVYTRPSQHDLEKAVRKASGEILAV